MDQHGTGTTTAGSPVEHLSFGSLDIAYDDSVLVPRPWTLAQSTWARELLEVVPVGDVLELCSGAGHIGLAAVHRTDRRLVQVDQDATACRFAVLNAAGAGVAADVRCGGMDAVLAEDERFALVVADPPWVVTAGVADFPEDPVWAIDGGGDGLDVARLCLAVAAAHLLPGGAVLLQVGSADQVARLDPEVRGAGLSTTEVRTFDRGAVALLQHGSV